MHGLVGQQHLISHSESGSSGRLLWSARYKDQSRGILKCACCPNKGTQFQTKGGISDGALRVTYYDSQQFVFCNFIFHVADPTLTRAAQVFPTTIYFRTQYFLEEQQDSINYYTIMKTYDYNLHI